MIWSIFSYVYLLCIFLKCWGVSSSPLLIFNQILHLIIEFQGFYVYFRQQFFIRYIFCSYFLPVCDLFSHSLDFVFHRAEVSNYNKVLLTNKLFQLCIWFCSYESYYWIPKSSRFLLCYLLGVLQFCILHLDLWSILCYLCEWYKVYV